MVLGWADTSSLELYNKDSIKVQCFLALSCGCEQAAAGVAGERRPGVSVRHRIHGKKVLRACSVNHRLSREDVDYLLDVIRDVGRLLVGKAQSV